MPGNPLQKHFRQPKVYVSLPSKGVYNIPGSLQGDLTKVPVYGMTGMDEIITRTPDALLSGQSTVKVIESCGPAVVDAWQLTAIDVDFVLTAIKIATYGNKLEFHHTCPECKEENDYELDLSRFIEHYGQYQYQNTIEFDGLTVKLQPLTYAQVTDYGLKNFALQQQMAQAVVIEDPEQQAKLVSDLFKSLAELQNEIVAVSIESVQTDTNMVTEQQFIREWVANSEKAVTDRIKAVFDVNKENLKTPVQTANCTHCGAENQISIDLDQSNFFVRA